MRSSVPSGVGMQRPTVDARLAIVEGESVVVRSIGSLLATDRSNPIQSRKVLQLMFVGSNGV